MVNENDNKAIIIMGSPGEYPDTNIYASYCSMEYDSDDYYLDSDSDIQGGFQHTKKFREKKKGHKWMTIYKHPRRAHLVCD